MARFTVIQDGNEAGQVDLGGSVITVGRNPESDIFINDEAVSRQHAEVHQRDGEVVLVDAAATNALVLNGEVILGEANLKPGDQVVLSNRSVLRYDGTSAAPVGGGPPGAPPPAPDMPGADAAAQAATSTAYLNVDEILAAAAGQAAPAPAPDIPSPAQPTKPVPQPLILKVPGADGQTHSVPVVMRITFGGGKDVNIAVPGFLVPGIAVEMEPVGDGSVRVKALGFLSGLRVDGKKVKEATLRGNHKVQVRAVVCELEDPNS